MHFCDKQICLGFFPLWFLNVYYSICLVYLEFIVSGYLFSGFFSPHSCVTVWMEIIGFVRGNFYVYCYWQNFLCPAFPEKQLQNKKSNSHFSVVCFFAGCVLMKDV